MAAAAAAIVDTTTVAGGAYIDVLLDDRHRLPNMESRPPSIEIIMALAARRKALKEARSYLAAAHQQHNRAIWDKEDVEERYERFDRGVPVSFGETCEHNMRFDDGYHSEMDASSDDDDEGLRPAGWLMAQCGVCRAFHPRRDELVAKVLARIARKKAEAQAAVDEAKAAVDEAKAAVDEAKAALVSMLM